MSEQIQYLRLFNNTAYVFKDCLLVRTADRRASCPELLLLLLAIAIFRTNFISVRLNCLFIEVLHFFGWGGGLLQVQQAFPSRMLSRSDRK